MSLKQKLQSQLTEARKRKDSAVMSVLQVILGDTSTLEARSGKTATDEDIERVIRKTADANWETLAVMLLGTDDKEAVQATARRFATGDSEVCAQMALKNPDAFTKAQAENLFLATLLPQTLTVAEVKDAVAEVAEAIRAAKNDGAATGVAMKALKAKNLKVLGETVAQAVKELRA